MGQEPSSPNAKTGQSAGVSSESDPAVPQWLLRPFPVWLMLVVFCTLCGIQLLSDYGPELPPRLGALTSIFKFGVAPMLIGAMFLSKWLRARAGVAAEKNDESSKRAGVFAVWVGVAIGVTVVASDAMGIEQKSGPITIAAAIAWAVYSLRSMSSGQATGAASEISHDSETEDADRDHLSRFVDVPEELERDLRGVGQIMTLAYMAVIVAPFGTYIIADQVTVPFVGWIIGFFGLIAILVFPIGMKAGIELNWLSITRRRPGAAVLVATSLAIVPWNPLLLLLLPWTIPALRRVRRPDVLNLIGVTEDDPRVTSVFGTGLGLLKNRAFLILIAMIVLTITLESCRVTHIVSRTQGLLEGTGTVSFSGLKSGGSILGPGNMAGMADAVDDRFDIPLKVGDYEIVCVNSKSLIERVPLTVGSGMWREHQVADWAEAMIIRGPDKNVRKFGLFRVNTRADVTCDVGQVYLPITGEWLVFAPPGEYRVTTTLKDGSVDWTSSTIPSDATMTTKIVGLFRTGTDVAAVRITKRGHTNGQPEAAQALRSEFFKALKEFVTEPEHRREELKLATPYEAGKPVTRLGTDETGRDFEEWELKSQISGSSNSLRNSLPTFRDYVEEIAKETGARIRKTTPTDGENRAVAVIVIEYVTATTKGTIEMRMTGFEDKDLHGHQMLTCGIHFTIQETAD